ncbi:hypothetical protein [Terracidiphilus gabretensis]|uniref:hypothetical protein n=1 Tax=Terracidiphilus gabretensis TaxID=1577687 RepID=UPI00071B34FC|nr:hypothetical protein [Terracidiphilus gabretensis]
MSTKKKLEDERSDALQEIHDERSDFESIVQRAGFLGEPTSERVAEVIARFDTLTADAQKSKSIEDLENLSYDADAQGQLRAYICPLTEIEDEGRHCLDLMAEWNVPASVLEKHRTTLLPKLKKTDKSNEARSALRTLYAEHDSWDRYTSGYEESMKRFTLCLVPITCVLLLGSVFSFLYPNWLLLGIVCAGAAGACTSVLSKMPMVEVELTGQLDSYMRRILTRVMVGTVASVVGSGFISMGIINITIGNQKFSDIICGCTPGSPQSVSLRILGLITIPLLLGFSERALTSFGNQFDKKIIGTKGSTLDKE